MGVWGEGSWKNLFSVRLVEGVDFRLWDDSFNWWEVFFFFTALHFTHCLPSSSSSSSFCSFSSILSHWVPGLKTLERDREKWGACIWSSLVGTCAAISDYFSTFDFYGSDPVIICSARRVGLSNYKKPRHHDDRPLHSFRVLIYKSILSGLSKFY